MRTAVIAARMAKSSSTAANGSPSIMSLRMASMYHRAGMMQESPRRIPGMFSIGKTIPESMMRGMSISMAEQSRAVIWRCVMVEMKSPRASARVR